MWDSLLFLFTEIGAYPECKNVGMAQGWKYRTPSQVCKCIYTNMVKNEDFFINICILHGMQLLNLAILEKVGEWHPDGEKSELGKTKKNIGNHSFSYIMNFYLLLVISKCRVKH